MGMEVARMRGLFVCGTDTGVGKTTVSSGLVRALRGEGVEAIGLKPVVSGAVRVGTPGTGSAGSAGRDVVRKGSDDGGTDVRGAGSALQFAWLWEDLERLALADEYALAPDERAVVRLLAPASPNFAAAREAREIDPGSLVDRVRSTIQAAPFAVVEGVGGFRVPLTGSFDTADLARALDLPCLLVVGFRLGCINHTLLTVEAMRARGLALKGWVANLGVDPHYGDGVETVRYLEEALGMTCCARLEAIGGRASLEEVGVLAAWQLEARQQVARAGLALTDLARSLLR